MGERIKSPFDFEVFLRRAVGPERALLYKKKKAIFSQGERANTVLYIVQGQVKITVVSRQGKEGVIGVLGPGDFAGESCLNGQTVRMSTVTALEPVTLIPVQRKEITKLLHDDPVFAHHFLAYVLARSSRFEEDLVDQLFNSSERRLARTLLLLAHYGKAGRQLSMLPRISQETLAEMIGTTRGRVSFFMNKFRKLGFIHYNGGLKVNSSLLNVVLHD